MDLDSSFPDPAPEPLLHLFRQPQLADSSEFLTHIRAYNSALALASSGISIEQRSGPGLLAIHGRVYHRMGALRPSAPHSAQFAQLYILDPDTQVHRRLEMLTQHSYQHSGQQQPLHVGLLRQLQECLQQHNRYVREFTAVAQGPIADCTIHLRPQGHLDTRYRSTTAEPSEVAGLMLSSEHNRDILVHRRVSAPHGMHSSPAACKVCPHMH